MSRTKANITAILAVLTLCASCATSTADDLSSFFHVISPPPAETVEEAVPVILPEDAELPQEEAPMDALEEAEPEALEEVLEEIAVEEVTEEPVAKEPNVVIPSPAEAFTDPDRPRNATIAGTVIPDWFAYLFFGMFLALLTCIGYVAKQRKLANIYRFNPRD